MVLGAGGMLGHDLVASAPAGLDVVPLTRAELDITDSGAMERLVCDAHPDAVVNAAAYTAVDKAESERELAFRLNGEAVAAMARLAERAGWLLVHYSTDYVFDGMAARPYREDDATNPINSYGASKLAGEQALASSVGRHLLIRTSWLFGVHGRSFPRTMWERAAAKAPSRVVDDQTGHPTYTRDLAAVTWQLVARPHLGVIHVTNEGIASWYDLARRVYSACNCDALLHSCRTVEFPTVARRPLTSVLDTGQLRKVRGAPLASWQDGLDRFLVELRGSYVSSPLG